ncbi:MAG: hypothetical protein ABI442_11095 [Gemmatimonadaceae bacterium]
MRRSRSISIGRALIIAIMLLAFVAVRFHLLPRSPKARETPPPHVGSLSVNHAVAHDVSGRLSPNSVVTESAIMDDDDEDREPGLSAKTGDRDFVLPPRGASAVGVDVEQKQQGARPAIPVVASFDGLGANFSGPQGSATLRNPSDNSLAVGRDHIVQIVNTRTAIFTKKGRMFDTTGKVLYGPVETRNFFKGFGGPCEARNNGDAVVRYDQLADRWLIVMPIFSRSPLRSVEPPAGRAGEPARESERGQPGQPGTAVKLFEPPAPSPAQDTATARGARGAGARPPAEQGSYAMCYAVSTGPDPFGPYYRYEFTRPLFPDYPRPAIWPDGYYVPSSTGDEVIQKQACVADRRRMLKGEEAAEQCVIIDGVNFLNNADVDGKTTPPPGAPNVMMAAGGTQLKKVMEDDGIYVWQFHVDWADAAKTAVTGPSKIVVAPYHYLCDGQLTNCVPQPGTDRRLDAQGDKLMSRLAYRRIGDRESIVAVHSVNTAAGGGGVRWYEFRVQGRERAVELHQQGTYAPDSLFRWMGSAAMDAKGNIGIGYSFGGTPNFAGQRFAARLADDKKGVLSFHETVLAEGAAPQTNTLRWEDYAATALDPVDDCTIWYVGDYLRKDAANYSTRIGGFRIPGCR